VESLRTVGEALRRKVRTEVTFKLVRTRVFLRTGVDLNEVRLDQDLDQALVAKVLTALRDCGHRLD
jgi:ribosomal protein L31E